MCGLLKSVRKNVIKLGKLTDYAIVLLIQLIREGEGASRSAHALAEKTGVPEPTVAKILKILAKENLVESTRGAAGGYRLARPAEAYSIVDVITGMDGPIAVVACVDGSEDDCAARDKCPVKGNWDRVNEAIKTALSAIKLTEMSVSTCGKVYDFVAPPVSCAGEG